MHLAATLQLRDQLLPALGALRDALADKAQAWAGVLKIGRTHLMDAVPMTQGQAFDAFAHQIGHGIERIEGCLPRLRLLPQGERRWAQALTRQKVSTSRFVKSSVLSRERGLRQIQASSRGWAPMTRWSNCPGR